MLKSKTKLLISDFKGSQKSDINSKKTMIKQKQKGFTLLELLIVIAIIGVLASVVLVSYPSATKKAKLGNALRFSDNIRGSLQQDMVAWWKFDETSGTIAKDTWWNQLHGTVSGATWVEGIKNNALSFDGTDDYVGTGSTLGLSSGSSVTVSAWINTSTVSGISDILNLAQWDGGPWSGWRLRRNGSGLIWKVGDGTSIAHQVSGGSTITAGNWHHVVGTYNGSYLRIYIDGVSVGNVADTFTFSPASGHYIGKYAGAAYYFSGLIDDVQIYSAALPVAVIQQHYAEGLKTHQNLASLK